MSPQRPDIPPEEQLSEEAAEWFLRMLSAEPDPEDRYANTTARNAAFREWYSRSPEHVRAFFDICEVDYLSLQLDAEQRAELDVVAATRKADVIPLYVAPPLRRRTKVRPFWGAAAAAAVLGAIAILLPTVRSGSHDFATAVGEQRTAKLDDGSIVYLNTDTQIEVRYTKEERDIRLVKGEALFVVEHDPLRPFIVTAENARVRAVGTQFNVRDRASSVDVSVVEGVVQVTTSDTVDPTPAPARREAGSAALVTSRNGDVAATPTRVSAGEVAHVTSGRVVAAASPAVADTVSWRQRRLVFKNATLGEVAAEFNRYNRVQVRVEGDVVQMPMFKAAVFDADRPQALILYASKDEALSVEADGENWVIRGR